MGTTIFRKDEQGKQRFDLRTPIGFAYMLRFKPFKYQEEFLLGCIKYSRIVAVWTRQSGKSTIISLFVAWFGLMFPNESILIISPTQAQSNLLFAKIINWVSDPRIINHVKYIKAESLGLHNGTTIKSLPIGDFGVGIRGHTASVIIEEEAGHIKDTINDEVIMPMGAAQPHLKIIKIGTPFGRNHFYRSAKSDKYQCFNIDYVKPLEEGLIKQEFIDEQRENLTDIQFRTEYEAEFIDEQDSYFTFELLSSCIEDYGMVEKDVIYT